MAGHWSGEFDEPALQGWVEQLRARLTAPKVSLGLVFVSPQFFPHARQVLEILRVHGRIPLLAGCSMHSTPHRRWRRAGGIPGIALAALLAAGRGAESAFHFQQGQVDEANVPGYWQMETGLNAEQTNGWLVFADPFHLDCENWLQVVERSLRAAAGSSAAWPAAIPPRSIRRFIWMAKFFEEGGVAISIGGGVKMQGVISQGCTPIG